jgi:hypothetical protein
MASDDQRAAIEKLNQIVQSTEEFHKSESESRLLKLATGDGMARSSTIARKRQSNAPWRLAAP